MRVLVIEDDGATRAILISTLRARRHEVVACEDAEAAWAAIGSETSPQVFDLALVDVGLPGQDGLSFCRQFRRHPAGRYAAVLLVTGDGRTGTLEEALDAGVHDYLLKPIDRRTLTIRLAIAEQRSLANATSRYSREALRESESRVEAFMNNSPAVAFIKDAHGRFLYVNRGYLQAFGISESDRLGRTHFEIFPPEVSEVLQRTDDEVLASGTAQQVVERVPGPTGVRDWLTYKFPLSDSLGHPTLVAGLAVDVTDSLRAERELKAQTERLTVEHVRLATTLRVAARLNALTDLEAVAAAICEEVDAALGTGSVSLNFLDEAAGTLRLVASQGLTPDERSRLANVPREIWEQYLVRFTPTLDVFDFQQSTPPDRQDAASGFELRSLLSALIQREGRILGTVAAWTRAPRAFTPDEHALLQGIADQAALAISNGRLLGDVRQAEEVSRHQRDRAEALLKVSRAVSAPGELPDILQAVSRQAREAVGASRASVLPYYPQDKALRIAATASTEGVSLPVNAFQPSPVADHERMAPLTVPVFEIPDLRDMSFTPNFELLWRSGVRSMVFARMFYGEEFVGIVAASEVGAFRSFTADEQALLRGIADIAALTIRNARLLEERRRAEEQMRNAQKLESLGVLAGGIAHDFNNLLVGVLGNAGLALMQLGEDNPARQAVLDIETSAQRAAELTRQMLAYAGRAKVLVEPINLSRIVEEMSQLLGRVISKQARLTLDLPPDLPPIVGDTTQVRQVVMNLITNASDALGGQPGLIALRTGVVDADRAMLASTYLDEQLPAGRYVCLEVSDTGVGMNEATRGRIFEPFFTTKFAGRGLGLAAVLGIVRSHKGALDVRTREGEGTTFRVLLPVAAQAEAAAAPPAPPRQWTSSGTVMVVDDEEAVRGLAARVLERSGFRVIEAASGEEALERCAASAGELRGVLLDLTMPGLGGEATLHEIRRRWPALPIVVSSGYVPEDDRELDGVPFLAKPYRPAELIDLFRRVLEPAM